MAHCVRVLHKCFHITLPRMTEVITSALVWQQNWRRSSSACSFVFLVLFNTLSVHLKETKGCCGGFCSETVIIEQRPSLPFRNIIIVSGALDSALLLLREAEAPEQSKERGVGQGGGRAGDDKRGGWYKRRGTQCGDECVALKRPGESGGGRNGTKPGRR